MDELYRYADDDGLIRHRYRNFTFLFSLVNWSLRVIYYEGDPKREKLLFDDCLSAFQCRSLESMIRMAKRGESWLRQRRILDFAFQHMPCPPNRLVDHWARHTFWGTVIELPPKKKPGSRKGHYRIRPEEFLET